MKKVYLIIIAYAFISLVLIANLGSNIPVEDESIDYDMIDDHIQVAYTTGYRAQYYDDNTPILDTLINVGNAFSRFGQRSFFSLKVSTGVKAVDTALNLFVLPLSIIINCCQLVFDLFTAITGIPFNSQTDWTSQISTWFWQPNNDGHGGEFTSGSSYGNGGGGVSGGR